MHRSTRAIATRLGEIEHFLIDALPGNGGIAVNQYRQDFLAAILATAGLSSINRPLDHGIDDFEVRRIEGQRQVTRPTGGHDIGRVAEMVFDVAGSQILGLLAFEFVEEHGRFLAERIDQHVQAAAVRHTDDDIVDAAATRRANHLVEGNNQRLAAFQRKTLLADVSGMQVALQRLRRSEALKQAELLRRRVGSLGVDRFDTRLNPAAFGDVVDVHVLNADPAAVRFLQRINNLSEGRALGNALE